LFKEAIIFVLLLFIEEMKALNDEISQNGATVWKTALFPVLLLLSVKAIIYVPLYTQMHYIIQNTHTSGHFRSMVKQDYPVKRSFV